MKYLTIFLTIILSISTIHQAIAQEALQEILVTASRIEEPAEETTSSVTVITSDDIKRSGAKDITDVLRTVPEMNLVQNGGPGKMASVILRGGDSRHVLVLVDGIRVNSPTTGSFDFSGILLDDIERIEIVKGPQSTVYGSEAMAGVINIITKKARKTGMELGLEAGSYGTFSPSISLFTNSGRHSLRLTGSYYSTDGISAASSGSERDSYENASFSGTLSLKPSERIDLTISTRYSDDRTELDGFDFMTRRAADDPNYVQTGERLLGLISMRTLFIEPWEQIIKFSQSEEKLRGSDPDTFFNNYTIKTLQRELSWQNNLYLHDNYTLTAGIDLRYEDAINEGNFDESRDSHAFYINNKITLLKELIINAGLRYDHYELTGNRTTYRLGALYNIKPLDARLRVNYGTGFRAPSMNELYYPWYGNTSLKPERSSSWEAGIEKNFFSERLLLSLTYFREDYKDLIVPDPLTWQAVNLNKAEIKGFETGLRVRFSEDISLRAGYSNLDAEDRETGERLSRRPMHRLNLELSGKRGPFSSSIYYTYTGGRYDSAIRGNLPPYSIVNISSSYRVSNTFSMLIRIENLFDRDYEEAGGYGRPGFSIYGGIKVTL